MLVYNILPIAHNTIIPPTTKIIPEWNVRAFFWLQYPTKQTISPARRMTRLIIGKTVARRIETKNDITKQTRFIALL